MASTGIYLTVVYSVIIATVTRGYKFDFSSSKDDSSQFPNYESSNFPVQQFVRTINNVNEGPIAGYPKVPPPNAFESGGLDDDLLPPLDEAAPSHSKQFKRSINQSQIPTNIGLGDPSNWDPSNEFESQKLSHLAGNVDTRIENHIAPHPSWTGAGGIGNILLPPFQQIIDENGVEVDSKTGYPLKAQESWKYSGGTGDFLQAPLDESNRLSTNSGVDPKTGYPLVADPTWKESGGTGEILEAPLPDGANSQIRQSGIEGDTWQSTAATVEILGTSGNLKNSLTDPHTGYPYVAEPGWQDAGGNGDNLLPPLEDSKNQPEVDPRTGYPLQANAEWADAGGNGDILQPPVAGSSPTDSVPTNVDPRTGYPLEADPKWQLAGGDETSLDLPLEDPLAHDQNKRFGADAEEQQLTELHPPAIDATYSVGYQEASLSPSDDGTIRNFTPATVATTQVSNVTPSFQESDNPFPNSRVHFVQANPEGPVQTGYRFSVKHKHILPSKTTEPPQGFNRMARVGNRGPGSRANYYSVYQRYPRHPYIPPDAKRPQRAPKSFPTFPAFS